MFLVHCSHICTLTVSILADKPTVHLNNYPTVFIACDKAHEAIAGILLKFGAAPNKACVQGVTPLHEAVRNKNLQLCKMLLQAKANIRSKNIYGIDPLFTAAQCGAVDVLYFLLSEGKCRYYGKT